MIDATEFSMPTMDIKLGFHQIAKFNYFPGWHQQISCSELLMNKKAYDALPEQYKAMIEVAAQAQVIYTYAETEATQFGVMAEMRDKHKVQIKRWPDEDAQGLREGLARGAQGGVGQAIRCSRRSPTTTSTTARSTRSGATSQFMKPTYQTSECSERRDERAGAPSRRKAGPRGPADGQQQPAFEVRHGIHGANRAVAASRLGGMLGDAGVIWRLVVVAVVVIAMLPEHARKELLYFAQDYLPIVMFLTLAVAAVLRLPGGLRARRRGADLRPDRLLPRHASS